jgi:hypothetical protein
MPRGEADFAVRSKGCAAVAIGDPEQLLRGLDAWDELDMATDFWGPEKSLGHFVPPIYVGTRDILIATSEARDFLEGTALTGFDFRPTVMKRIVRLDWRHWDFGDEDPERYPAGCEPENYVLARKHNPKLAEEMAPLWEVHVEGVLGDGVDADLVRSLATEYSGYLLASPRAHELLSTEYGDWLSFDLHTA